MPTIVLAWDASTDPTTVGYRAHAGQSSGIYSVTKDFGNILDGTIDVPFEGGWYCVVGPLNAGGQEGPFSNEIFVLTPITAPVIPSMAG